MNKKVPFAVIAGALAASALVAPISGAAQAPAQVESGLYFTNPEGGNGAFYSFTKWASLTPTEQSNLVLEYKPENIKIFNKVEDKLASLSATVTAESFDGAATAYTEGDIEGTFVDATTGDKIVVAPVVEEVTVESVSAINDTTIAANEATDLKFSVNGKEELTKAEFEKKYEGYTASFLFNKSTGGGQTFNKVTGKVTATDTFKYAVQVTDADGNKLPETVVAADFADVKVADATKAVEVTEFGLVDWDLDYITTGDKTVEIKATKALNTFGNEVKESQLPVVETVTSSDPTVAYYDGAIQPRKEGNVTLTVKFAGIEATSTIEIEVKAAQKVTSIQADNQKIQAGTQTANQIKAYFDVLDQYGEELRIEDNTTIKVIDEDSKEVVPGDEGYNLAKAGIYTVEVNAGNVKLGSFTIETVEVDASKVDEYKIVADKGFGLDLNPDLKDEEGVGVDKTQATLDIEAFVKGVKLNNDQFNLDGFEVKSSNEDVVEAVLNGESIDLTAEKAGNSTISLIKVEGDLRTTVATYEVEVANTTELVDTLTLKEDTKVEVEMSQDGKTVVSTDEEIAAAVATATVEGEKDENLADKIASVEVVQNNKVVIVKLTETYGGNEFVLDAKFVTNASPLVPATETVVFSTDEEVTAISNDEVTYKDGNFLVPTDVTEFTFTEGTLELTATKADGEWTFTTSATEVEDTANVLSSFDVSADSVEAGDNIVFTFSNFVDQNDSEFTLTEDLEVAFSEGLGETTATLEEGQLEVTVDGLDTNQEAGDYAVTVSIGDIDVSTTVTIVDTTDPTIVSESTNVEKDAEGNLVLTVQADDINLYSLEIDHSHGKFGKYAVEKVDEDTGEKTGDWVLVDTDGNPTEIPALPEFTIYASEDTPEGTDSAKYEAAGVSVEYDSETQTWTLTFAHDGNALALIDNSVSGGAIEFYLVANDTSDNSSGDMDGNYVTVPYSAQ